ncbi:MAG TPA: DUF177 domain-containing protein [Chitinophagaceae bacterium]|nr:DUF177 domain-containing protein [Chitinophagaceae bacterium]
MKKFREFEISWTGLKEGEHIFQYELDDEKLEALDFTNEDFTNVATQVNLSFDRHHNFFELLFDFDGSLTCSCDRCGDTMHLDIWDEFKLIVKLVETPEEADNMNEDEDNEIVYIARSQSSINVFKWLYDFLILSIPIQKIHSNDESGKSLCNPKALELLKAMEEQTIKNNNTWKGLEQFKKK